MLPRALCGKSHRRLSGFTGDGMTAVRVRRKRKLPFDLPRGGQYNSLGGCRVKPPKRDETRKRGTHHGARDCGPSRNGKANRRRSAMNHATRSQFVRPVGLALGAGLASGHSTMLLAAAFLFATAPALAGPVRLSLPESKDPRIAYGAAKLREALARAKSKPSVELSIGRGAGKPESYRLVTDGGRARILATDPAGAMYGCARSGRGDLREEKPLPVPGWTLSRSAGHEPARHVHPADEAGVCMTTRSRRRSFPFFYDKALWTRVPGFPGRQSLQLHRLLERPSLRLLRQARQIPRGSGRHAAGPDRAQPRYADVAWRGGRRSATSG